MLYLLTCIEDDKDGKELHQSLEDILEDLHDLLAHITLRNDRQTFDNVGWRQEVSKYLLIIDTRHVGDKFPNASADIVDRLGAANRDRRAKISFLKARREALGTQDEGKRIGLGKSADFSLFHDSAIGLSIESRIHGAGSASRLLRPGDSEADYAEESDNGSENTLTSYTATVPESAENPGTLTVPPLPHEIYQNKPFNCPTCGKILRSLSDYGAWKYVNLCLNLKYVGIADCSKGVTSSEICNHMFAHIRTARNQSGPTDAGEIGKPTKSAYILVSGSVLCVIILNISGIEKLWKNTCFEVMVMLFQHRRSHFSFLDVDKTHILRLANTSARFANPLWTAPRNFLNTLL